MSSSQLNRISGLALMIGAVVFVIHVVLRSLVTAGVDPVTFATQALWLPVNALGLGGALLVLFGLPAMYVGIAAMTGKLGFAGIVLLAVAWLFFGLFLSLYAMLIMPWLAESATALVAASTPLPTEFVITFIVALLAWLVGSILLAIPFIRGRLHPRWAGYLLAASGIWVLVGNLVIAPSGPASNLAINLLSNLGPILLLVPLGYLGFRMRAERALGT